jgi:hypothetical protein
VIKESHSLGTIFGQLNYTFLCHNPKKKNIESLEEYHPISCNNVTYKLISKIIDFRLRPILSKVIGDEQFIFLQNRKIHDAVATTQESIHWVKKKETQRCLPKVGFVKIV